MFDLLRNLLPIVLFLLLIILSYRNVSLRSENKSLTILNLQAEADKDLLKKQIMQAIEDRKLVESEEFMMFLSKSREAAFTYIEEAQAAIAKFDKEIEKILDDNLPSMTVVMRILDANNELQKLLPDNIRNNNVQGEL